MGDVNSGPDGTETDEHNKADTVTAEKANNASEAQSGGNADESTNDTFPRSYVEDLRRESAGYRDRVKTAEERTEALSKRLHRALVEATARLENPDDLPFDAAHLDDADNLTAALDALLADRPYLARRVVKGDAGQGARGDAATKPSFADLLRGGQ